MKKEARRLWLRGLQRVGCLAVFSALAMVVGCGGGGGGDLDAGMSEDEKEIVNTVSSLADIAATAVNSGNLDRLRESFTSAAAPTSADAQKMKEMMFRIPDAVEISGTNATFDVEITTYAESSTQSMKTWTAVKEGDQWKLSETPM